LPANQDLHRQGPGQTTVQGLLRAQLKKQQAPETKCCFSPFYRDKLGDMRNPPGKEHCPQETLNEIVRDIIRRQIAVCLALWLAVIVPISCEHHVLMTLADDMGVSIRGHDHQIVAGSSRDVMTMEQHSGELPCSFEQ